MANVWLDGMRRPMLDHSVPQVGAPAAWQAGYTGGGVTVAVLEQELLRVIPELDDDEAAYYQRLLDMTVLVLEAPDDSSPS